MRFKFSLVIPINLIMGLAIKIDEVPVTANTKKTLINSHLYSKFHLLSSFLNKNKVNFKRTKKIVIVKRTAHKILVFLMTVYVNLYEEYIKTRRPKKGKRSCQFCVIFQCSLNFFM